jgi:hypothetical protein
MVKGKDIIDETEKNIIQIAIIVKYQRCIKNK